MNSLQRFLPSLLFIQSSSSFVSFSYDSSANSGKAFMVCSNISSSILYRHQMSWSWGEAATFNLSERTWWALADVDALSLSNSSRSFAKMIFSVYCRQGSTHILGHVRRPLQQIWTEHWFTSRFKPPQMMARAHCFSIWMLGVWEYCPTEDVFRAYFNGILGSIRVKFLGHGYGTRWQGRTAKSVDNWKTNRVRVIYST